MNLEPAFSTMKSPSLYAQEAADFQRDGVVIFRQVMPLSLITECREAIVGFQDFRAAAEKGDAVLDEPLADGTRHLKYFQNIQMYIPPFRKLFNSRLLMISRALLNQEVYFNAMGLHDKCPRHGTLTPLHQDNFYRCLTPPFSVTAYIVLEEQSRENGGLHYVKGSHHQGTIAHQRGTVKAFSSAIEGLEVRDEDLFRPYLKPGDVAFHHTNTFHGADGNKSDKHRRAVAVGIFGELAQFDAKLKAEYESNREYNRGHV